MGNIRISKIEIKRDICVGAASCVVVSPDVFELDNENKAVIKNPNGDDDENILLAAQSCPVQAIFIYDEQDRQIYP